MTGITLVLTILFVIINVSLKTDSACTTKVSHEKCIIVSDMYPITASTQGSVISIEKLDTVADCCDKCKNDIQNCKLFVYIGDQCIYYTGLVWSDITFPYAYPGINTGSPYF
jgi:hypothetical protein